MKIENTKGVEVGKETKTGGFEQHAPGRYLFEYDDVEFRINEETNSKTYFLKCHSVEACDGAEEESIGKSFVQMINVFYVDKKTGEEKINAGGERDMFAVCTHTGVQGALDSKFDGDENYADNKVADTIKLKLPGQLIKLGLEERKGKDAEGKPRVNVIVTGIDSVSGAKKASGAVVVDSKDSDSWEDS